ncbi:hypothetical protein [Wolbachia endosymbiont of Dirofilaria (Dirofilaria) immitis]|uniref:hypothetical protein n=1 Tax=Wolbachia endosymbiont of Dirofilaria (Dirofilaria) immitis TaxID=1812115 RepID=UPI00397BB961
MSVALKLTERTLKSVSPNPAVRCVIVKDGIVVSKSHTGIGRRPHAEAVPCKALKTITYSVTMYVTLETYCHFEITEPCTAEIIRSRIKKVVIAIINPDKRVLSREHQSHRIS